MKKRKAIVYFGISILLCISVIGGFGWEGKSYKEKAANISVNEEEKEDRIRLEDDYYTYVNEALLSQKEIPSTEAQWSYFNELNTKTYEKLDQILAELEEKKAQFGQGSIERRIVNLYDTGMDKETRNQCGLGQLQAYIDKIMNASTMQEYAQVLAGQAKEIGEQSFFVITPDVNLSDSTQYHYYVEPLDLVLGKEYLENQEFEEQWQAYQSYMVQVFCAIGETKEYAEKIAQEIFQFQKEMAAVCLPVQSSSNPSKINHSYTSEELCTLFSNINFQTVLEEWNLGSLKQFIVTQPEVIKKMNDYLAPEHLPMLKNYARFVLLHHMAPYLTEGIRDARAEFYRIKSGKEKVDSPQIQTNRMVQELLSMDFGKLYVQRYFSEDSKTDIKNMVKEILEVYEKKIDCLNWMSCPTKEKAKKKLKTMTIKIGYPEEWPSYLDSAVVQSPQNGGILINNVLEIRKYAAAYEAEKTARPVEKQKWLMPPQTVNAYYNPSGNEIVFPAAILQYPFYDKDGSYSENLGGIGAVIAHEISHAFDDNGAQYDENGNLNNWWSKEDYNHFKELQNEVVDYYNGFEVFDGHYVNGERTLGENIADLAGVSCVTEIVGNNRENLQKLFNRYAAIWASKKQKDYALVLWNVDVHAPDKIRVNAVLSSCEAFYQAYDIKETDKMYVIPDKRVKIW